MDNILQFLRPRDVWGTLRISRSQYYAQRADDLLPEPVLAGKRIAVHPADEIAQVQLARVRGASDAEVRVLVRQIESARVDQQQAVSTEHAHRAGHQGRHRRPGPAPSSAGGHGHLNHPEAGG